MVRPYSRKRMRLRVIRNRFFTRAVGALLALLVCGSAVGWGHVGGDDRDCDIVVVHHDHNAHRFSTAPANSPTDDHCYICHSLRLLHHAVATRYGRAAVALQARLRLDSAVLAVRDGLQFGVPSRAPPSVRL
jgi:hypothetical protein